MAWTAEKVKAMRESNPAKAAESDGWTAEKVRAMRTKTPTASAATVETTPKQEKTPLYADPWTAIKQAGQCPDRALRQSGANLSSVKMC